MHIFWRVFGGAILSICALIGITLFNNLQSNIAELRNEVARINEARGDYVRKDEFNTRITLNYDRITNLAAQNSTQNASIVSLRTDLDSTKERLAKVSTEMDALRKDAAALETVKEKLNLLLSDLKSIREDFFKVKAELEKNMLADQDRKIRRDEQAKEFERLIRELNAALQECQVKVARLEGKQESKPSEPSKPKE